MKNLILLSCLLILVFQASCRTQPEKDIYETKKLLEITFNDAYRIIQNEELTNNQKIAQINVILVKLDSLSKIWENKIESYRTIFSEKELDKIENENRLLSEGMGIAIIKEMPEYKDIFKRFQIPQ